VGKRRWHYGAPKGLLARLFQVVAGGGVTYRREGPAIPEPPPTEADQVSRSPTSTMPDASSPRDSA
jgi:hypothetical protein